MSLPSSDTIVNVALAWRWMTAGSCPGSKRLVGRNTSKPWPNEQIQNLKEKKSAWSRNQSWSLLSVRTKAAGSSQQTLFVACPDFGASASLPSNDLFLWFPVKKQNLPFDADADCPRSCPLLLWTASLPKHCQSGFQPVWAAFQHRKGKMDNLHTLFFLCSVAPNVASATQCGRKKTADQVAANSLWVPGKRLGTTTTSILNRHA